MNPSLRFLALDLYPCDDASEWAAASAQVFLVASPDEAVALANEWLSSQGWRAFRLCRNKGVAPDDWEAGSDGRRWAQAALEGRPQVHTHQVPSERWLLSPTGSPSSRWVSTTAFATAIREYGALSWFVDGGVSAVCSPAGGDVLPLWPAHKPPSLWRPEHGEVAPLDFESLVDNILPEVALHNHLVGLGWRDDIRGVHPERLRRALLFQADE